MVSAGGVRSEVALKVLHTGLDPRSQAVQRLKDEAKLLGLLNHPSILGIHDLVLLEDRVTLVTEFVDGADLDQCVLGDDPIPVPAVLNVLGKIADALHAAYTQPGTDGEPLHLLHRDIKPSNIRIGKHGEVKLLDFGIAKAAGFDREAKTQTNAVIGSFPYMAPERFDQSGDTTASDVYSLGCVLFESVAGERLHEDKEVRQLFAMAMVQEKHDEHLQERLPLVQDAHPLVVDLMTEMLAFDAEARPSLESIGIRCEDLADEVSGMNLSRWARRHVWPEVAAGDDGVLAGRTITEASLSKTTNLLTGSHDTTAIPVITNELRPAAPPTAVFAGPAVDPEPEPEPAAVPLPVSAPVSAPAPVPAPVAVPVAVVATPPAASSSSGRAVMIVGLLVLLLVAIGAATLLGGTLVAMTLGAGDDVASETPPPPQTANPATPEDGADPLAVATDSPKPGVRRPATSAPPNPEAADGEDGVAEMDVVDAGNHDAAPVPEDCGDPLALEPSAILGQLTDGLRSCLSAAIRDTSKSQTDRAKLGRVLLVDATSRCDNGGGCAAYESEQR